MRRHVVGLLLVVAVSACGDDVRVGLGGLFHYDDFNGTAVDVSKWTVDTTGNPANGTASVTVSSGRAILDVTATLGDIQSTLEFPPALATGIGRIGARAATISYSEGPGSNVRYRLFLRPYKDNKFVSAPAPDLTSDIFAQLRLRAGQFQAMVSRCLDTICSSEVIFGPTNLGAGVLGQTYDLSLIWDGGTVFAFSVSGLGSAVFDATEGGLFANIGPSGNPRAKLEGIATSGAPTTGNVTTNVEFVDCERWRGGLC